MESGALYHKTVAVLTAVLFGPLTWIYTLDKDKFKLGVGLAAAVAAVLAARAVAINAERELAALGMPPDTLDAFVVMNDMAKFLWVIPAVWFWAIADRLLKPVGSYEDCDGRGADEESAASEAKSEGDGYVALLLALCFGPFTWLYTLKKDGFKFWLSVSVAAVGMIIASAMLYYIDLSAPLDRMPVILAFVFVYVPLALVTYTWAVVDRLWQIVRPAPERLDRPSRTLGSRPGFRCEEPRL